MAIKYNIYEKRMIGKVINQNPEAACKLWVKYIEEYPLDYYAYIDLSFTLIKDNKISEAKTTLDYYVSEIHSKNKPYLSDIEISKIEDYIFINRVQILLYSHEYEQALELLNQRKGDLKRLELEITYFYIKSKLGLPIPKRYNETYISEQIRKYQESSFYKHIKKHLSFYQDDEGQATFSSSFPFIKVFEEAKKYIPSVKHRNDKNFSSIYTFRYDNCGVNHAVQTDYFVIICLEGTDQMITAYPIRNDNVPEYTDLNYLDMTKTNHDQKRLTRIERFNSRYNQQ